MKKIIMMMALMMCFAILIIGCGEKSKKEIVLNEGTVIVQNGKGLNDTIPFTCVGCQENLSFEMFEIVKNENAKRAKDNLINPLSFKSVSMDIVIIKEDSLYDFETNEKIDSVLTVITKYQYIGQNAYGTEISGGHTISFYLVNGLIEDISENIKLENLKFEDEIINRNLYLSHEDGFIDILPTEGKSLIVNTSIGCVDEGTMLFIKLLNGDEIKLNSWNEFNCDGISYFRLVAKEDIEKLKYSPIERISVVDDEYIGISVPKNNSDYFIQLINLYN